MCPSPSPKHHQPTTTEYPSSTPLLHLPSSGIILKQIPDITAFVLTYLNKGSLSLSVTTISLPYLNQGVNDSLILSNTQCSNIQIVPYKSDGYVPL